jgi:hypothetical protein
MLTRQMHTSATNVNGKLTWSHIHACLIRLTSAPIRAVIILIALHTLRRTSGTIQPGTVGADRGSASQRNQASSGAHIGAIGIVLSWGDTGV